MNMSRHSVILTQILARTKLVVGDNFQNQSLLARSLVTSPSHVMVLNVLLVHRDITYVLNSGFMMCYNMSYIMRQNGHK
jgi:hypothetical protein